MRNTLCALAPLLLALLSSCASVPPSPPALSLGELRFQSAGPFQAQLTAVLRVAPSDAGSLETVVAELALDGVPAASATLPVDGAVLLPVVLAFTLPEGGGDEYHWTLTATGHSRGSATSSAVLEGQLPHVREPRITITGIKILKAELINTRLEVGLRIENPNLIPLTFDRMGYELFGEGHFWADGAESATLSIAAGESLETKLRLVMNFIDMGRPLLDQVVQLEEVHYRFKGTVGVRTELPFIPEFRMDFDLEGLAPVLDSEPDSRVKM